MESSTQRDLHSQGMEQGSGDSEAPMNPRPSHSAQHAEGVTRPLSVSSSMESQCENCQGAGDNGDSHRQLSKEDNDEDPDEEMEVDETEGLRKSIKRGFKVVKQCIFGTSVDQGRGDNPPANHSADLQEPPPLNYTVEDSYDFTHPKRGRAIIINMEKFRPYSGFDNRPGSNHDAVRLAEMFKMLGFDVASYANLTAMDMKIALEKEARQYDHQDADCLAVAILSHGDSEEYEKSYSYYQRSRVDPHSDKVRADMIFGVDGRPIPTASVLRTFQDSRCPGLCGKPRLFFLQACRGGDFDDGVPVRVVSGARDTADNGQKGTGDTADNDGGEEKEDEEEVDARGSIHHRSPRMVISPSPLFKDFLVMYATTPGHFAWRRSSGTWFIQSLHSVFTKELTPHLSLTQALTRVARMVAQGYESKGNPTMKGKKQTPVLESMLTKDVYFPAKGS